jgi:TldD protein
MARARDPRVRQVMANLAGDYEVVLVARQDRAAEGLLAADVRPLSRLSLTVIVEENGRREQGFSGGGGRVDLAYFDDAVLKQYVDTAVDMALANLAARAAKRWDTGSRATSTARARARSPAASGSAWLRRA